MTELQKSRADTPLAADDALRGPLIWLGGESHEVVTRSETHSQTPDR